jgi:hypothetical protein
MISVNDLQNLALGAAPVLAAFSWKALFDAITKKYLPQIQKDTLEGQLLYSVAIGVFAVLLILAVRFERKSM